MEYESLIPSSSFKPIAVSLDEEVGGNVGTRKVLWPTVIMIVSLIYAILYMIVHLKSLSNPWRLAACFCLFSGVLGVGLKRKAGVTVLLIGAYFGLLGSEAPAGEWLIIGREIDADILDIHRTLYDPSMHTIALLTDTLLTYDWNMNLIPLLAERYEVTPFYIDFHKLTCSWADTMVFPGPENKVEVTPCDSLEDEGWPWDTIWVRYASWTPPDTFPGEATFKDTCF